MPEIPRFTKFATGTGRGAQLSPATAASPHFASAENMRQLSAAANDFMRARVVAERATETAEKFATAVQRFEEFDMQQVPYDDRGAPQYKELVKRSDEAYANIRNQVVASADSPAVKADLSKQLTNYWNRRRIEVMGRAHDWEIKHRAGQLQGSLTTLSRVASASPSDMATQYMLQGVQAIKGAEAAGVLTPESAAKAQTKFVGDIARNRVRAQIHSGNVQQALLMLEAARSSAAGGGTALLSTDDYFSLLGEAVTEAKRLDTAERKQRADREAALAIEHLTSRASVSSWDALAQNKEITDVSLYNAVRNASLKIAAGEDDPDALRDFYESYARGEHSYQQFAGLRDKTTVETFGKIANTTRSTLGKEAMFKSPQYKQALEYIDSRLRESGMMARFGTAEQTYIPFAKWEFAQWASTQWDGSLDLTASMEFAEQLVRRYNPRRYDMGQRNMGAPTYQTGDQLTKAYEDGKLGAVGSDAAMQKLYWERKRIRAWADKQQYESNKNKNQEPQGSVTKGLF